MFLSFGHRTKSGWGKKTCELIPPHQSLTRQLPPQGEAFYVIFLVRRIPTFLKVQRIQNPKSKIALSNRLPPGGKLSRKRLMRGDISALSSSRYINSRQNRTVLADRLLPVKNFLVRVRGSARRSFLLHRKINLPQFFDEQIYPPHQSLTRQLPPRGKPFTLPSW